MREARGGSQEVARHPSCRSRMDKNGNVKISVTGYTLSYCTRFSAPRGIPRDSSNPLPHNFLGYTGRGHTGRGGRGRERGRADSPTSEEMRKGRARATGWQRKIEEGGGRKRKGTLRAPFRELISHEPCESPARASAAILLNYGADASCVSALDHRVTLPARNRLRVRKSMPRRTEKTPPIRIDTAFVPFFPGRGRDTPVIGG